MSVPDPATTKWVPLQGTAAVTYLGQWAPGRTYNDGDAVIGSDGILYLCCVNGTTTAPDRWPGAGQTGAKGDTGPQGPQGVGIPMPVIEGQWVKGSGGAAVWSPINASDVVGRPVTYTARCTTAGNCNSTTGGVLAGTTITAVLPANSVVLAIATADLEAQTTGFGVAIVDCQVDGAAGSGQILFGTASMGTRVTIGQNWVFTGLSAGSHTFRLWGRSTSTGGSCAVQSSHTALSIVVMAA